jgi:hypothetical protein
MVRVRARWLTCALALAGCDIVFRLDHLSTSTTDAGSRDGDGPDAPPVQPCAGGMHDEDHDGIADACDVCPGIADDQADADTDGVGNACDPSGATQHEIALFLAFANDPQGWTMVSGNWTNDGESMVYDAPTEQSYGIMVYTGVMPEPPFVLEYHYKLAAIPDEVSSLSVILDSDSVGHGVTCGYVRANSPLEDLARSTYSAASKSAETVMDPVAVGEYRVTATYDRQGTLGCSIKADDNSTSGAAPLGLPSPPTAGTLGFRSMLLGVRLDYVAIYKER